jgi:hypothetical protein
VKTPSKKPSPKAIVSAEVGLRLIASSTCAAASIALCCARSICVFAIRETVAVSLSRSARMASILAWLRSKVHRPGQRFSAEELIEKATGKGLDAAAFFRYIEAKHLS